MNSQNGLYVNVENKWEGILSSRVERLLKYKLIPDAFFCIDKKPIVLFYDSPKNKEELFKAVWNFNESPVVIINEPNTVEIFNGLSYRKNEKTLERLGDESKLNAFSYFELMTGKTWRSYEGKIKYQNRVDYHLLKNIKYVRDKLINEYGVDSFKSNALIGKCIFIRYLIDRKVRLKFGDGKLRVWSNDELCKLLENKKKTILFLNYLREHFNGEAFLLEDSHLSKIPQKAFDVLSRLMRGTEITSGQMSLFDIYDFSIIPVEFISNVYEHFIGEESQAKKGAYYTPLFLVEYIVTETVEKYFYENPKEYNCKVLDPACGSGIFLVEALRRMLERYQENNKITSTKTKEFKEVLKKIAEENIYGIDQDENAINVAIFSIYLALLDYQEPKEIEDFKFPELIDKNFFINDFFDHNADFNNVFKETNFNFILGNPPWKRGSSENALFLKYIKERKGKESSEADGKPLPTISNKEIAQAFLLRTSNFSSTHTKCALIVTSKTLYNLNAKDFRRYFIHNYFIDKVLELAPVRREVFDKSNDPAIAPAAVLFFHYARGKATDKNIIEHMALKPNRFFSLFKIFMLQRNDYKQVVQARLMEHDWLWKVLVYGSYMDFNFIRRLEEHYETIGEIIYNRSNFLVKQGLKRKDGNKKINVKELIGWDFIDLNETNPKHIEPFFIYPKLKKWEDKYVGYIYRENENIVKEMFSPPVLLLKETVTTELKSIPAISLKKKILFTDKITSIKDIRNKNSRSYYEIAGFLYSSLFSYFILIKSSTVGIMIEQQVHDKEKFSFPYIKNSAISKHVKQIEKLNNKLFVQKQKALPDFNALEDEKQNLQNNLDNEILNSFSLNEQERALVDYSVKVTIPLLMKHKGYEKKLFSHLKFKDPFLRDYAEIFFNRFKNFFGKNNKKLTLQIVYNEYIIGMFFKVATSKDNKEQISWVRKAETDVISKLLSLGCQEITEYLFIQKDIRGFERDGFYIIKPNEKKLWHKAIAYLDLDEFVDAILRTGRGA